MLIGFCAEIYAFAVCKDNNKKRSMIKSAFAFSSNAVSTYRASDALSTFFSFVSVKMVLIA